MKFVYCADCGQPYALDPMKRVRCHSGDMWSTEPPLPRDSWFPAPSRLFNGVRYYLYGGESNAPGIIQP